MSERRLGIAVAGDKIIVVEAEVPREGATVIDADLTWNLQKGNRCDAYRVLHHQVTDHISNREIKRVIVKASALSQGGMKKSHLDAAELRGVVICASAMSQAEVVLLGRATISRNFGERKMDEYLKDNSFWSVQVAGIALRGGSREAAMLLIADRGV